MGAIFNSGGQLVAGGGVAATLSDGLPDTVVDNIAFNGTATFGGVATFNSTATFNAAAAFIAAVSFALTVVAPAIGPSTGQQHTLPAVSSDTVALLAAPQTFTNKTLTTPTINGAALTGTFSGAHTYSGAVTFGSSVIAGTIGPTSGQQHTLPAVSSDTFALLGAAQTFTNKTFTNPTINAAALSGTFTGTPTFNGVVTFGAAPVVSVTDASNASVTDVLTLTHKTSGTSASGLGTGILFQGHNAAGTTVDIAALRPTLSTTTAGSEAGGFRVWTRTAGGVLTLNYSFGGDGGLVIGSALAGVTALGAAGLGLANNIGLYVYESGVAWRQVIVMDGTNQFRVGHTSLNPIIQGASVIGMGPSAGSITAQFRSEGSLTVGVNATNLGGIGVGTTNTGTFRHRNAANSGWNTALQSDASDQLLFGDANHRRIVHQIRDQLANYTTTARDALTNNLKGDVIMNSTTNKINVHNGTAWEAVTSV